MSEKLKNLPSIRELIKIHKLAPEKKLGQNFLMDQSITDHIVNYSCDLTGKTVLEIGPGPGLLTRSLLYSKAKKIFAIERDDRCIKALKHLEEISEGRLELIAEDALRFDENSLTKEKLIIIANLPYNIGTALLLKWLENINKFEHIIIMLQKEVVLRLIADEKDSHYGRLSILVQLLCDTEALFDIDPSNFYPAPKVISTVVRLTPLTKQRYDCNIATLAKITAAAFGQRRKMLRSSLKSIFPNPDEILESIGIDSKKRAEHVSVKEFTLIANKLDSQ